jgi:hypothetical protein
MVSGQEAGAGGRRQKAERSCQLSFDSYQFSVFDLKDFGLGTIRETTIDN